MQPGINSTGYIIFLELSIVDQLKSMFNRKGFYNDLGHRLNRKKHDLNNTEDIYDGHRYNKLDNFLINKIIFLFCGTQMGFQYLNLQNLVFGYYILQ